MPKSPTEKSSSAPEQSEMKTEITLGDLFLIIRERWLLGLAVGLLLGGLLAFYLLSRTPVYESTATLLIELEAERIVDIEEVRDTSMQQGKQLDITLNNHIKQLESRNFLEYIHETRLSGKEKAILNPYLSEQGNGHRDSFEEDEFYKLIDDLRSVKRERNTQIIAIQFEHRNAKIAAMLSNAYADGYIDYSLLQSGSSTESAVTFLKQRADELRLQVAESEKVLQAYREEHNLIAQDENADIASVKVKDLNQSLTEAEVELVNVQVKLNQVKLARETGQNLVELPFISKYGSIPVVLKDLDEKNTERERLSEKYLERHPKMIAIIRELEASQRVLKQNINLSIADAQSLEAELTKRIGDLKSRMEDAEGKVLSVGSKNIEQDALRRQVDQDREMYEKITERLNETAVASKLENINIKSVDKALVGTNPVKPNKKMAVLASAALFGLSFLGLPLFLGLIDSRVKSVSDLEHFIKVECAGAVPLYMGKELSEDDLPLACFADSDETITESFRGIYSFLDLSSSIGFPKSIVISSTTPAEGKSFVSSNVSAFFGRHQKKTLIMDCDFRKPTQHRSFKTKNEFGTLRWFKAGGELDLDQNIFENKDLGISQIQDSSVYLLTTGGSTKSPTEMMSDPRFEALVSYLTTQFDLLLIDTPPVGLFPDALFMADMADEVIFVSKHNSCTRQRIKTALNKFEKTRAKVIGVVMNQMKYSRMKGYGYGKYGYYGYGSYGNKEYSKYYDAR